jgi:hypothetical protein
LQREVSRPRGSLHEDGGHLPGAIAGAGLSVAMNLVNEIARFEEKPRATLGTLAVASAESVERMEEAFPSASEHDQLDRRDDAGPVLTTPTRWPGNARRLRGQIRTIH